MEKLYRSRTHACCCARPITILFSLFAWFALFLIFHVNWVCSIVHGQYWQQQQISDFLTHYLTLISREATMGPTFEIDAIPTALAWLVNLATKFTSPNKNTATLATPPTEAAATKPQSPALDAPSTHSSSYPLKGIGIGCKNQETQEIDLSLWNQIYFPEGIRHESHIHCSIRHGSRPSAPFGIICLLLCAKYCNKLSSGECTRPVEFVVVAWLKIDLKLKHLESSVQFQLIWGQQK